MRYLGQHVEETVNICIAVTEPPRIDERKEGIFEAMGNDTRDSGGKSLKIFIVSKDVWDSVVVLIHTVNDENGVFSWDCLLLLSDGSSSFFSQSPSSRGDHSSPFESLPESKKKCQ